MEFKKLISKANSLLLLLKWLIKYFIVQFFSDIRIKCLHIRVVEVI